MKLYRWCLAAAALLFATACGPNLPSDAELIASFNAHRPAFERARQILLQAEGIERVDEDGAELLPLPSSQRQEIADLMEQADVALIRVFKSPGGDAVVDFTIHRSGFVFAGALKGIVWSTTSPPPPLLASLDDPTDRRGFVTVTWFNARRRLPGGWYLELSKG